MKSAIVPGATIGKFTGARLARIFAVAAPLTDIARTVSPDDGPTR